MACMKGFKAKPDTLPHYQLKMEGELYHDALHLLKFKVMSLLKEEIQKEGSKLQTDRDDLVISFLSVTSSY